MAKNKINFFTMNVNGDNWNVYKISETDNVTLEGEHSEAEIDFDSREIHFKRISLASCLHETWHLYKHYTLTENAHLDAIQEEEVSATMFERWSDKMIDTAKKMHEKLKELS
jgi:hypothetical protein